jgi:hypothetical protein
MATSGASAVSVTCVGFDGAYPYTALPAPPSVMLFTVTAVGLGKCESNVDHNFGVGVSEQASEWVSVSAEEKETEWWLAMSVCMCNAVQWNECK